MAKEQKVYMPLMIGDWLKGTRGMKAEVRGVYINLLLYQWDNGFIPSDMEELCLIDPELPKVWDKLKHKFSESEPGKLQNKKAEDVRAFWSKQRDNGKLGGRPPGSKSTKYISPEKLQWEEMVSFFDNSCVCCGYKFPEDQRPTKDHIIPRISGGTDDISNIQPLCRQCNSSKHATHTTDYRLKYISRIPKELRDKWFPPEEKTQPKPKGESKHNLHNDLDLDNDIVIENKKESKKDSRETEIPFVDGSPVMKAWLEWEAYRKEKKKKLTPSTVKKQIQFLGGRGDPEIIEIINQSIRNGWDGLFDLKTFNNKNHGRTTSKRSSDATIEGGRPFGTFD